MFLFFYADKKLTKTINNNCLFELKHLKKLLQRLLWVTMKYLDLLLNEKKQHLRYVAKNLPFLKIIIL